MDYLHRPLFRRCIGYVNRWNTMRRPTTRSELVSCMVSDRPVGHLLLPVGRFLAPRATDYLPVDGEKFHAALARVITPIRGVMICVSSGAPRLVQLRYDASSQNGETTRLAQWCVYTVFIHSADHVHPCCLLTQLLQQNRVIITANSLVYRQSSFCHLHSVYYKSSTYLTTRNDISRRSNMTYGRTNLAHNYRHSMIAI